MKLTENECQYLKTIYRKQREQNRKIKTSSLAKTLNVSPASVTEVFQHLAKKKLLKHNPYYGIKLTEEGVEKAREQLRKHRILEILFVRLLNYTPKNACREASHLDYHVSRDLINSICQSFNHPQICPCKKKIFSSQEYGEEIENDRDSKNM